MASILYDSPLHVSQARPILSDLIQAAFDQPVPVRIKRRNGQIVRLVPEIIPDPVEVLPEGALHIDADHAEMLNRFPVLPLTPKFQ
jgi:hypothetical protein